MLGIPRAIPPIGLQFRYGKCSSLESKSVWKVKVEKRGIAMGLWDAVINMSGSALLYTETTLPPHGLTTGPSLTFLFIFYRHLTFPVIFLLRRFYFSQVSAFMLPLRRKKNFF